MQAACVKSGNEFKNWVAGDVVEFHKENHPYTNLDLEKFNIIYVENTEVERIKKEIKDYNIQSAAVGALPVGVPFAGTKTTIRQYIENGELKWRIIK